ncbi:MAG: hypothetical protein QXX64_06510 [Nitrososphaera sp.]
MLDQLVEKLKAAGLDVRPDETIRGTSGRLHHFDCVVSGKRTVVLDRIACSHPELSILGLYTKMFDCGLSSAFAIVDRPTEKISALAGLYHIQIIPQNENAEMTVQKVRRILQEEIKKNGK